jgi:hypothetical protein
MNYFASVQNRLPVPRIHPLLLSLSETLDKSNVLLNISSISECDPRILGLSRYTPSSEFPSLDIHISDNNGVHLFFDPSFALTSTPIRQLIVLNVRAASTVCFSYF